MQIVLASSNKGKLREIKAMCEGFDVVAFSEIIEPFEIIEDAPTFKGNALLKAKAVYDALDDKDAIVLSDDSGISVDVLDGAPGIYSARFGGEGASDKDNLHKVMDEVKASGADSSPAHYTAAIAIVTKEGEQVVHGWMYGDVITTPCGENGFGYDPCFIPEGFDKTLSELDDSVKKGLSHRSKALYLARLVLATIKKGREL